jgi:hypothetical protein
MRKLVAFAVALCVVALSNATPIQATAGSGGQAVPANIEFIRAHVTIDPEGMFVIDRQVVGKDRQLLRSIFDPLNNNLATVDTHLRPTVQHRASKGPGLAAPLASWCGYVPKWAYQAFAWYVILVGGTFSVVGLFVDATIFGLPAGAVLGAAGISLMTTGSFMLWYVDNFMPSYGVYVCVF